MFFKSNSAVGIEIDTGTVRALELKGTVHSASVSAAGQVEIPIDAVDEGVVMDVDAVGEALKQLWGKESFSAKDVVLGVCNPGVIMRKANFPKAVEKKLGQVIRFQAGDFFPISLSEMVLDYSLLGEIDQEKGPELEVLLVAARRDTLEQNLAALAIAGLEPKIVDYSPLALLTVVPESSRSGTTVLVDINQGFTTLLLAHQGIPRFSRVIPYSFSSLVESGQPLADEKEALQEIATAVDDHINITGESFSGTWGTSFTGAIRSSINYYLSQQRGTHVDLILLSGRGALVDGLPELLQSELEVPVESINAGKGPDFAVCHGLALRGLEAK